jgi:hypothetical protein
MQPGLGLEGSGLTSQLVALVQAEFTKALGKGPGLPSSCCFSCLRPGVVACWTLPRVLNGMVLRDAQLQKEREFFCHYRYGHALASCPIRSREAV